MKSLPHCGQENRETVSNSAIDFAFLKAKTRRLLQSSCVCHVEIMRAEVTSPTAPKIH